MKLSFTLRTVTKKLKQHIITGFLEDKPIEQWGIMGRIQKKIRSQVNLIILHEHNADYCSEYTNFKRIL